MRHLREFCSLSIASLDDFVFGKAPHPVRCGRGVVCGAGTVIPEINFTLPSMEISEAAWPEIRKQYSGIIHAVCARAVQLEIPALLVELETLPPMTNRPEWGAEITAVIVDCLDHYFDQHSLRSALRLTPNDNRDHERPVRMRQGPYWENMVRLFERAAAYGADLLAIESTGGKEVSDQALMNADLSALLFALGVLAPRDMEFLWSNIVSICQATKIVPSGDTACAFGNTAMVLAEQKMIPRVFAAVVRVATVPRSLVAYEMGATGPSKDCAYEGPYLKAIAGVPISMEGRTAACAHLSPVGNIAQAVCDCWSNESVQNVRLLSGPAPVASLEQLAYDCRLMNVAAKTTEGAQRLRQWLSDSDGQLDPQAFVLRPDAVLRISERIIAEETCFTRTLAAIRAALDELSTAHAAGSLRLPALEVQWLDRLRSQADSLPDQEEDLISAMLQSQVSDQFLPAEYALGT